MIAMHRETRLSYEVTGSGPPVVFLHGLTFDRRTWRPIIDRLDGVQSIAIDLPAHGESGGEPASLPAIAALVHDLLASLGIERPIVVGHSLSAGVAFVYACAYPTRGLVVVDQGMHVQPFAELLHRLEPVLRGPGFAQAWQTFEDSLGLDRIPEPTRSLVLETHRVRQEVVLGYWETPICTDPSELQAEIDEQTAQLDVPCLAVFGRPLSQGERARFERLPQVELEEWDGSGHFVHLVDPDRFAARLSGWVADVSRGAVQIIPFDEISSGGGDTIQFLGATYGSSVSFFVIADNPGEGPDAHWHPYDETFVLEEGVVEFTVDDETIRVEAGHVVVVPAGAVHGFKAIGPGVLRSVNIHPVPEMETTWIE